MDDIELIRAMVGGAMEAALREHRRQHIDILKAEAKCDRISDGLQAILDDKDFEHGDGSSPCLLCAVRNVLESA